MGRDKALLPWHGSTFLRAHIDVLKSHTDFVLIVAGRNHAALESLADASGAYLTINPQPERGQFSSLQIALQETLNRGRDAAVITPVDRPPVRSETIVQLRHAFEQSERSVWAVVPEHAGHHGHPIVVGREMITAFMQAPATSNAREVQHLNQAHIAYVTVEDELIAENINTPEQYKRIAQE